MSSLVTLPLVVIAPTASACVLYPHGHQDPASEGGASSGGVWLRDDVVETGLGEAEDLGRGLVAQHVWDGADRGAEASVTLQDCTSGEAMAFGGDTSFEDPSQSRLIADLRDLVEARLSTGQPMQVGAEARARGLLFVAPMRTESRFEPGGQELGLGCGYAPFYPDLPGAPHP